MEKLYSTPGKSGHLTRHRSFQLTLIRFGVGGDLIEPITWRLIRANCRYSFLLLFHVSNDRFSFLSRLNSICKNLNKSAVRRNSFSQFGVKPGLPLGSLACARASFVLSLTTGALASMVTGGGLTTGFASSRREICLMTIAPTTIRDSGPSTYKSLACLMAIGRTALAISPIRTPHAALERSL